MQWGSVYARASGAFARFKFQKTLASRPSTKHCVTSNVSHISNHLRRELFCCVRRLSRTVQTFRQSLCDDNRYPLTLDLILQILSLLIIHGDPNAPISSSLLGQSRWNFLTKKIVYTCLISLLLRVAGHCTEPRNGLLSNPKRIAVFRYIDKETTLTVNLIRGNCATISIKSHLLLERVRLWHFLLINLRLTVTASHSLGKKMSADFQDHVSRNSWTVLLS